MIIDDFNKKITTKIFIDLQKAKDMALSLQELEYNINLNINAVDSTFPKHIREAITEVLSKIDDHRMKQYAATLNTPKEGTYDYSLPIGNLVDLEIDVLEQYLNKKRL